MGLAGNILKCTPRVLLTLRAKLSGAVYCNRSYLWVCMYVCVCVCVCVFVGLL